MTISKNNFTHKVDSYVIYIFAVRYKDGIISHVKYFFKNNDGNISEYIAPVDVVAKHIYFNQWQAWAGEYREKEKCFMNASKVVPGIKDGFIFLTTISDDYKTNNLEYLPRF